MIVVTGATGHVGNTLVRMLIEQGEQVRATLNNPKNTEPLADVDCEKVFASLNDVDALTKAFEGADYVFHCAAFISIVPGVYDKLHAVNVQGVQNVIDACKRTGVKRLVHLSSVEAIGNDGTGRMVTEEMGFRPEYAVMEYGRSKAEGSILVQNAVKNGELDAVIVSPVGIIGPNDFKPSQMGSVFIDYCNRDLPAYVRGHFDFVDARDVAATIIAACRKGRSGENYLCTGESLSMPDMINLLQELTGIPKPKIVVPIDLMVYIAIVAEKVYKMIGKDPIITRGAMELLRSNMIISNEKARKELGIQFRSIKDSVRDELVWLHKKGRISLSGRPRRRCTSPGPARSGRRYRPPWRHADWPA